MERYQFQYRDQQFEVSVEHLGDDRYRLRTGDLVWEGDLLRVDEHTFLIIDPQKQQRVSVARDGETLYLHVAGHVFRIELASAKQSSRPGDRGEAFAHDGRIEAPMPGKVSRILVQEGEQVEAGQSLFILEAMKMENEIRAPAKAKVEKIHYAEGDLVSVGEVVMELALVPQADQE